MKPLPEINSKATKISCRFPVISILCIIAVLRMPSDSFGQTELASKPSDSTRLSTSIRHTFVEFSGTGLLKSDTANEGKDIIVNMISGFVGIKGTEAFIFSSSRLYGNLLDVPGRDRDKNSDNVEIRDHLTGQIFLNVAKDLILEIKDRRTDTTVQRYILRRLKYLPQLRMLQNINGMFHLSVLRQPVNPAIAVIAGVPLFFEPDEFAAYKNAVIEYNLVDLATKRSTHFSGNPGVELPALKPGSKYELLYNFQLQPETVGRVKIEVENSPGKTSSVLLYGTIGMLLLSTIILVLLYISWRKNRLSKKQKQKLEDAAISLQTSLNPHFTFNALSTIQGLINTGKIDDANEYLQEFGSLLRKTLTKSQHVYNTLDQEMEMMRLYLRIEALRFNFSWIIDVSPDLNTTEIEIPTLLLQPIIENSVKHGAGPLGTGGQISIRCEPAEKKDSFVIVVKDNGNWKEQTSGEGYGLHLTRKRLATINKLRKDSSVQVVSDKTNGTEIRFIFQNWIQKN